MVRSYYICFLLLIVLFANKKVISQPFHYLDVGISQSSFNQLSDIYSNRWELSSVNSIQFRTPFYLGIAGLNVDLFSYKDNEDKTIKVNSLNTSVFFGLNIINQNNFKLSPGILIGIQTLESSSSSFSSNTIESELFYAFTLEPQIMFKNFILFSDFQYRKVFNYYRQNLFSIGVGLKFRLNVSNTIRGYID
ncbi:MAG: hypothetical protein BalsKO_00770 [Balneolaceae bacterium]